MPRELARGSALPGLHPGSTHDQYRAECQPFDLAMGHAADLDSPQYLAFDGPLHRLVFSNPLVRSSQSGLADSGNVLLCPGILFRNSIFVWPVVARGPLRIHAHDPHWMGERRNPPFVLGAAS